MAAIVLQSLLAAERSSSFIRLLVGWVVVRLVVCWTVFMEVSMVVAVDVGSPGSGLYMCIGPGLTLALAADSAEFLADSSLDLRISSYFWLLSMCPAAHESLISREMIAEVPLTGLSFAKRFADEAIPSRFE